MRDQAIYSASEHISDTIETARFIKRVERIFLDVISQCNTYAAANALLACEYAEYDDNDILNAVDDWIERHYSQ